MNKTDANAKKVRRANRSKQSPASAIQPTGFVRELSQASIHELHEIAKALAAGAPPAQAFAGLTLAGFELAPCDIGGCTQIVVLRSSGAQPICAECVEQLAECDRPFESAQHSLS